MKASKLAKDPLFIDKVHDTVGLYLDPPPMLTFVVYLDEHWFAALTEKQLRRRVHRTTGEPRNTIHSLSGIPKPPA